MSLGRSKDPAEEFPVELFLSVLRYLRTCDLTNAVLVRKSWNAPGTDVLWQEISTLGAKKELRARGHILQLVKKATFPVPSLPLPEMPRLKVVSLQLQRGSMNAFADMMNRLQTYPCLQDVKIIEGLRWLTLAPWRNVSFQIPILQRLTLRGDSESIYGFFRRCVFPSTLQELVLSLETKPYLKEGVWELMSKVDIRFERLVELFPLDLGMLHLHLEDAVIELPFAITWSNGLPIRVTGGARSLPSTDITTVEEVNFGMLLFPQDLTPQNVRTEPSNWQSGQVLLPLPDMNPPAKSAFIEIQDRCDVKVDFQVVGYERLAVRIFASPLARREVSDLLRRGELALWGPLDLGPEALYYNPRLEKDYALSNSSTVMSHECNGIKYVREWTGI